MRDIHRQKAYSAKGGRGSTQRVVPPGSQTPIHNMAYVRMHSILTTQISGFLVNRI